MGTAAIYNNARNQAPFFFRHQGRPYGIFIETIPLLRQQNDWLGGSIENGLFC